MLSIELNQNEKLILNLVQDHLKENRKFNIKRLLSLIQSRIKFSEINLNKNGIETILRTLINKNYLAEGSTLTKPNVLDNEKRNTIYNFILENPGTYFNKLVKNLNLNYNVIIWHLRVLKKFNFIQKTLIDNRIIYFEYNLKLSKAQKIYFLKKKEVERIINFFKENNGGVTKTRLAEALNMHYNTLKNNINKLEKLSLIKKIKKSNSILYSLNSRKYDDLILNIN